MSKLENWQRAIREGEEVGIVTSATPKPSAGEHVPDLTSESPDYRYRAEKIGEIYDDIAHLLAERDAMREQLEEARAQALADRGFQSENTRLRERERELVEALRLAAFIPNGAGVEHFLTVSNKCRDVLSRLVQ